MLGFEEKKSFFCYLDLRLGYTKGFEEAHACTVYMYVCPQGSTKVNGPILCSPKGRVDKAFHINPTKFTVMSIFFLSPHLFPPFTCFGQSQDKISQKETYFFFLRNI